MSKLFRTIIGIIQVVSGYIGLICLAFILIQGTSFEYLEVLIISAAMWSVMGMSELESTCFSKASIKIFILTICLLFSIVSIIIAVHILIENLFSKGNASLLTIAILAIIYISFSEIELITRVKGLVTHTTFKVLHGFLGD